MNENQNTSGELWAITELGALAWQNRIARLRAADVKIDLNASGAGDECDIFGDPLPKPETINGVAVIPLKGVMCCNPDKWDRAFGACDTLRVAKWVEDAKADASVRGITIDCDSPGGQVAGTPELSAAITTAQKEKPVTVIARECASAALWACGGAEKIIVSQSSTVGSVGVFSVFVDRSKLAENLGIKVQVFRSGKIKGAGTPGTSLNEDQAAQVQSRVNELGEMFRSSLSASRPQIKTEDMEGQWYFGSSAVARGFADEIGTRERAIKLAGEPRTKKDVDAKAGSGVKAETETQINAKEPKKMNELETAQASIKDLQTKLTAAEKLAEDEMTKNAQAVKDLDAAKAKITELEAKAATDAKNFATELTAKESSVEQRAKLKAAELAGQAGKATKSFETEEKAKHEAGGGASTGNDIAAAKAAREARKGSTVKSWNTSLSESAKNMAR